jgi:hypothetical protein
VYGLRAAALAVVQPALRVLRISYTNSLHRTACSDAVDHVYVAEEHRGQQEARKTEKRWVFDCIGSCMTIVLYT